MATAWDEIAGRAVASVQTRRFEAPAQWTSSEPFSENWQPNASIKAVMMEFLIRWPCPAAADEGHHFTRMLMLFWDCRDIAPGMLRKAGDAVARTPNRYNVMPSASEIISAVETIMEERAVKQRAEQRNSAISVNADGEIISQRGDVQIGDQGENTERCREHNRQLMREGATYRVFPVGAFNIRRVQVVDDGRIVPNHVCNGDGTFRHVNGHSGLWPQ